MHTPIVCDAGYHDADRDGDCDNTLCSSGSFDSNSDGLCEVQISIQPPQSLFDLLDTILEGGVIPETGGLTSLDGESASTLNLPAGGRISFSDPLAGFYAGLVEENQDTLPSALPDGVIFGNALTVTLQSMETNFPILPFPVTQTITFPIPADLNGKSLSILFWDPKLNGGLGGWVKLPLAGASAGPIAADDERLVISGLAVNDDLTVEIVLNFTGTFVLVADQ